MKPTASSFKLMDVGKVINTLAVILQIFAVVVKVLDLVVARGLIFSATLSVAVPIVGAVLAFMGIGLMINIMFVDMYATEPRPDPVGEFVDKSVSRLTRDWQRPPEPKLLYA